ncbi:uncharacterized protein LOC131245799 [Magnolia sinica]|uniref:uncharacterized protein LOC131245799 n=1 Tax=Magnolia sinica TaxID=86752 RepID=UPI00265A2BB1|nr:uncharacterized protein LOC131245799 [Magnolia sinica]
MGCFLACFGEGKRRKHKNKSLPKDRSRGSYKSLQPSSPLKQTAEESVVCPLPESSDKPENLSFNSRKKVTFDLNVKTYEEVSAHDLPKYSSENEEEKERVKEEKKEEKASQPISTSDDNSTISSTGSFPSNHRYQNCVCSDDENDEEEEENMEYEDSDFDDDRGEQEEVSTDSCFSLPIKREGRNHENTLANKEEVCDSRPLSVPSPDQRWTLLANKNARDRSQYVHPVLNPIENLSQWKAVKASSTPLKQRKKESVDLEQELQIPFSSEPTFKLPVSQKSFASSPRNFDLEQELHIPFSSEPTFKLPKPQISSDSKPRNFDLTKPSPKQEISVDTSLSNWLVSSENTPSTKTSLARTESSENSQSLSSRSSRIYDDRPILGALTVEELRQHSVSSSPRRSPSRSPDDIPILGTVGSYWNSSTSQQSGSDSKGIPNTTSKYREDKRVNWHNTPFEVRLERALIEGAAEAYSSYPPKVC